MKKMLLGLPLLLAYSAQAQGPEARRDSSGGSTDFSASITVTNNGISLIPSFTLARPAALFSLFITRRRLSFEPELRYALDGKPWSFIFWGRYQAIHSGRFNLGIGVNPSLNFRTLPLAGGTTGNVARRFLAAELASSFRITARHTVGAYYLYSRGLDAGTARNTHFIALNGNLAQAASLNCFALRLRPQLFYLKQDRRDGFYANATITLTRKGTPFTLYSILNKAIDTDIVSKDFIWNLSLMYSFQRLSAPLPRRLLTP